MPFDYQGAKQAGYSDDEIAAHLGKERGFDVAGARSAGYSAPEILKHFAESDKPTTSHAAGVLSGIREAVLDAPAQLLERGVKAIAPDFGRWLETSTGSPTAQEATESARRSTANFFGADEGSTGGRIAGNVIGSALGPGAVTGARVSGSLLPQALARQGARAPVRVAAAEGALTAPLTQTVDDPNADFWSEKLHQTLAGGAGGAAGTALARGAGAVFNPAVRPEVALLQREGVGVTPGQILGGRAQAAENRFTSLPILGDLIQHRYGSAIEDFNRALYNRALGPIHEKFSNAVPIGREAVEEVAGKLGSAYDDVLSRVKFTPDDGFRTGVANLAEHVEMNLPPELAKLFEKRIAHVERKLASGKGTLSGEELKALDADIGLSARTYADSQSAADRELARALGQLQSEVRAGLARTNPQEAARLSDINSGWAVFARLRDAAGRAGSMEGVVTPTTLAQAVRAGATRTQRAAGGAPLQDISDAARSVLRSKVPDSGTAERGFGGGLAAAIALEPFTTLKKMAYAAPLALPYLAPKTTASALTKRPEISRRLGAQVTSAAPLAGLAGTQVAGDALRPDQEALLRGALAR